MHDMQTIVKVFKMLHHHVEDGVIYREAGTKHGIDRETFVVVVFFQICSRASSSGVAIHITPIASILADMHDNIIHVNEDEGYIVGGSANPILIDSHNLGDIGICQKPNLRAPIVVIAMWAEDKAHDIYACLTNRADKYPTLHDYLLADLRHIQGKQIRLIAPEGRNNASVPDHFLKRHRSFLEILLQGNKLYPQII